jgi:hypothetical protein
MEVNVHVHQAGYYRRILGIKDRHVGNRKVGRNVGDEAMQYKNGNILAGRCACSVEEAGVPDE